MKYAVEYWDVGEDRDPRRTRMMSLKMAKRHKNALEHYGHETRLMPKSELPDEPTHSLGPSIMNRDVINHWKFIPKFLVEEGEMIYNGMICVKNGQHHPLHKLP